ncbi:hypothetical protein EVAR_51690_1 [Eumeta japonica]|uniref:Uncharacterized protein n=1 Tax=Eumeta variegata TaxID=151549 RepID=A0A4C1Y730_EUMVA|nr:hypothetical protein EVAR_51690_1 [Eumeta japonica]
MSTWAENGNGIRNEFGIGVNKESALGSRLRPKNCSTVYLHATHRLIRTKAAAAADHWCAPHINQTAFLFGGPLSDKSGRDGPGLIRYCISKIPPPKTEERLINETNKKISQFDRAPPARRPAALPEFHCSAAARRRASIRALSRGRAKRGEKLRLVPRLIRGDVSVTEHFLGYKSFCNSARARRADSSPHRGYMRGDEPIGSLLDSCVRLSHRRGDNNDDGLSVPVKTTGESEGYLY